MLKQLAGIGVVLLLSAAPVALGQKPGAGGGSPSQNSAGGSGQQASGPGGSSLPGLSYTDHDWPYLLKEPPANRSRVVLCYKLKYSNSASQPFILEPIQPVRAGAKPSMPTNCSAVGKGPIGQIADKEERLQCLKKDESTPGVQGLWNPCSQVDLTHPIMMRDLLVIGIDANEIRDNDRRLRLLNINVTNQQGNPINPTPVRPSFGSSGSTSQNAGNTKIYFLTWPYELPGDVIPTVSVNTIYTPPPPGAPWRSNTFYPAGSVVTSSYGNGHFYTALKGGLSAPGTEPAFAVDPAAVVQDRDIVWSDSGTTLPTGTKSALWAPGHSYCLGDMIFDPYNGHYYSALVGNATSSDACTKQTGGLVSGAAPTDPFPVAPPDILPSQTQFRVYDGSVLWELRPSVTSGSPWAQKTLYPIGSLVRDAAGKHEYRAISGGTSGPIPRQPYFSIGQMASQREQGENFAAVLAELAKSTNDSDYQARLANLYGKIPSEQYDLIKQQVPTWNGTAPATLVGLAGATMPRTQEIDPVTWLDVGTTAPASVASGQPQDQTVNLSNLTLPQVHSLYYYNVAAGVVVSTIRSPNLATVPLGNCTMSGCGYSFEKQGSNLLVDPVLFMTWYPVPWDAERPYRLRDLRHVGLNFGLSLASPANNFYLGAATEIRRNIQLVAGFNVAKISRLSVKNGTTITVTGGTPTTPTQQYFAKGAFIGLSYNISGFIQGLFGGGGGGGGGGAGGKSSGQ